jgi:hypothetical protein
VSTFILFTKCKGIKKDAAVLALFKRISHPNMLLASSEHFRCGIFSNKSTFYASRSEGFSFRLIQGNSTRKTLLNNSGILSCSGIDTVVQVLNITVVVQIIFTCQHTFPASERKSHASNFNIAIDAIFIFHRNLDITLQDVRKAVVATVSNTRLL